MFNLRSIHNANSKITNFFCLVICFCSISTPSLVFGANLNDIQVKTEVQDGFKNGKQKIVVWVFNKSSHIFNGTIRVSGRDFKDSIVDKDIIFTDDIIPGSKKYAILWFKDAEKIKSFKYNISGNFKKLPDASKKLDYLETGKHAGNNYMSFFICTPYRTKDKLQQIINDYKRRYKTLNGMQIWFYDKKEYSPKNFNEASKNWKHQIGSYSLNRLNDYESLMLE